MANWSAAQPQPAAGDHDDRGQPGQVQRPFQGSSHGVATPWERCPRGRVQVAGRFSRIAYQMVAGRKAYRHPCCQQRDYILNKLLIFHVDNEIGYDQLMRNLDAAVVQLPRSEYREEAVPLADELDRVLKKRGKGPRPLSEILPVVLAKLGVKPVRSPKSGEAILT